MVQVSPLTASPWLGTMLHIFSVFQFPNNSNGSSRAKLVWLIQLRWLAILTFFGLSIPFLYLGILDSTAVRWYLGTLCILFVFNILNWAWSKEKKTGSDGILFLQMVLDLALFGALILLSGGYQNPVLPLLFLNVSLGAFLLNDIAAISFLVFAHILLAALQYNFLISNITVVTPNRLAHFAFYHFLVFGFWIISRALGSYTEKQSQISKSMATENATQNRLRAIGALAAGFSHEFASPLNTAQLRLERVKRHFSNENVTEAIAAIKDCQLIIQQMNSSQLDASKFSFKMVSLSETLDAISRSWQKGKPDAKLTCNFEPVFCRVPEINLSQVIFNLLDNAYESKKSGKITLSSKVSANRIEISVSDEGPGFSDYVLSNRGEPFITTKPEGTGLGLYVSELFAHSLGGDLKLLNNNGAVIVITWPLASSDS